MSATQEQREQAYEQGKISAEAQASWITLASEEGARHMLKLMEDGDPRLEELLPARPNLSGEWADDPTPATLARDILGADVADMVGVDPNVLDELAEEFERGVSENFERACERRLREYLA